MMKKLIVYGLSFMVLVLFTIYHIPYTIYAAESSPSADIKLKLDELKKEIASKAAKLKQEVNRKLKDKAYIGIVKSKSETTLTLATDSGPKIINISQDTIFESKIKQSLRSSDLKSSKSLSQKDISLEDYVASLGDSDETGVLTARKVILIKPPSLPKTYLWSQIVSISDQLITLKNSDFKNTAATLPATPEIKLNDFVILTGNKNKNDIFNAEFVYVIPKGGIIKPKKIATSSARLDTTIESQRTQTSSKSATPKKTLSPRPTSR